MRTLLAILIVVQLLAPPPLPAQTEPSSTPPPAAANADNLDRPFPPPRPPVEKTDTSAPTAGPELGIPIWRYIFSLLVIGVLMGGGAWALRNVVNTLERRGHFRPIRVRSRISLDTRNSLALVRVGDEDLLVGSGPGGVTLLRTYAAEDQENDGVPEDALSDADDDKPRRAHSQHP